MTGWGIGLTLGADAGEALEAARALWLLAAAGSLGLFFVVIMITVRRAGAARRGGSPDAETRRVRARIDAWREAGRRAHVPAIGGADDDDTVDLDPPPGDDDRGGGRGGRWR